MNHIALLQSALRALRVRDAKTFNARLATVGDLTKLPQDDLETRRLLAEVEARARLFKVEESIEEYTRFLLKAQEPLKALEFLKKCRPSGLEDSPALNAMQGRIESGLRHLDDFNEYKRFYGVPYYLGSMDISTGTARGQYAVAYAKAHPEIKSILSVGPNDGLLERALLTACPEATLEVAELAGSFNEVLTVLEGDFPGRVKRHEMASVYDWSYTAHDLVILFEVLEHLPNEVAAAGALSSFTKPGGAALVSVPVGYLYVEDHKAEDSQYQHVRAFNADSLEEALMHGFETITVSQGSDRTYVAECRDPK